MDRNNYLVHFMTRTEPNTPEAEPDRPRKPMLPIFVALALMVVWGGTPLFSKLAVVDIDPLMVGVLRTVIAGALALPIALAMRLRFPTGAVDRRLLVFSGVAAFVAFPLVFTVGQSTTSALHGALILATLPVFTSLFGTILERRRVSRTWIAGCVIALASEVVVIVARNGGTGAGTSLGGDLLVLVAAVVCAMGYVAGAHLSQRGYPALSTTLWGVSLSSVIVAPLGIWLLVQNGVPHAGPTAWSAVLTLAVLTSVVGYVAWYWALAKGGISRVASVQFTQPFFGIALAALILGERPSPITAVAGVGVLLGAWLVLRAGAR